MGSVNGNGAVVGGGFHQLAPPSVVVAPSCGGGGGVASGGPGVEKVKFTVSVRGHQWSSARHVNETLEEFAAAIQVMAKSICCPKLTLPVNICCVVHLVKSLWICPTN